MAGALTNTLRLAKAGLVLAQHGVRFIPEGTSVPPGLRLARALTAPIRWVAAPFQTTRAPEARLAAALTSLGPSYIKLGQFLATRPDVIGPELAQDLAGLQDNLPPFPMAKARRAVEQALGGRLTDHDAEFGPAVAAASIAQVHKAMVVDERGRREVAVKILRPGVERRFRNDLDSYYFAARQIERIYPPAQRLKPTAVVDTLRRTTEIEMDLRLEAAAISEMAENIEGDHDFRVPDVD
jgi:ubiquinone biosynthesis protein